MDDDTRPSDVPTAPKAEGLELLPVATLHTAESPPATLAELIAMFPGSTADWREKCQLRKCTLDQARTARIAELENRLVSKTDALSEAESKVAAAAQLPALGAEPNESGNAKHTGGQFRG